MRPARRRRRTPIRRGTRRYLQLGVTPRELSRRPRPARSSPSMLAIAFAYRDNDCRRSPRTDEDSLERFIRRGKVAAASSGRRSGPGSDRDGGAKRRRIFRERSGCRTRRCCYRLAIAQETCDPGCDWPCEAGIVVGRRQRRKQMIVAVESEAIVSHPRNDCRAEPCSGLFAQSSLPR
jgi:hypothetical protein